MSLTTLQINDQQQATILAALRFYQQKGQGDPYNRSEEIHLIATNDDDVISLDDTGIDELCRLVNSSSVCSTDTDREYLDKLQELATEVIHDVCTQSDIIEVDQLPSEEYLSEGEDGTWVRAWVLVDNERLGKAGLLTEGH